MQSCLVTVEFLADEPQNLNFKIRPSSVPCLSILQAHSSAFTGGRREVPPLALEAEHGPFFRTRSKANENT